MSSTKSFAGSKMTIEIDLSKTKTVINENKKTGKSTEIEGVAAQIGSRFGGEIVKAANGKMYSLTLFIKEYVGTANDSSSF